MYSEALRFREAGLSVGRVLIRLRLLESSVFDAAGSVQGYTRRTAPGADATYPHLASPPSSSLNPRDTG